MIEFTSREISGKSTKNLYHIQRSVEKNSSNIPQSGVLKFSHPFLEAMSSLALEILDFYTECRLNEGENDGEKELHDDMMIETYTTTKNPITKTMR